MIKQFGSRINDQIKIKVVEERIATTGKVMVIERTPRRAATSTGVQISKEEHQN